MSQVQIVFRRGMRKLLLDVAHRVIAEVTREAARETRQPRALRHLEAPLELLNEFERIALVRFDHLAVAHHLRHAVAGAQ